MQQEKNGQRRTGQQNAARPRKGSNDRRAYDWTQDRRPSGPSGKKRRRPQGYQEQVLDFSGGSVTFESTRRTEPRSGTRRRSPDNSIQFPQQGARRSSGQKNQNLRSAPGGQASRPTGQRPRSNNTMAYPGTRPRNGQPARPNGTGGSAGTRKNSGRYRPTQANLRSPARRESKKKRRLTRAALRRRRAFRRLAALALLVCVIAVGVYLTVTMLFKINTLQVVADGAVVEQVGGYSSTEILEALGVHAEENIFSFDPEEKAAALEKRFPLLEHIQVVREYPNTVVVKAEAAVPVYTMQTSSGWLSLSAGLKILDKDSAKPDLTVLYGGEPLSTTPGVQLEFEPPAQAESASADSAASDSAASSAAAEQTDKRLESLNTLLAALDSSGLGQDVGRIEFEDPEQVAFLYQGRISVLLGTLNELDYKLRLARYVLLNEDGKGFAATDTGMLDLSHLSASSTRKFRFAQGEPILPSGYLATEEAAAASSGPEQAADSAAESGAEDAASPDAGEAAPTDETTAAAAEQE